MRNTVREQGRSVLGRVSLGAALVAAGLAVGGSVAAETAGPSVVDPPATDGTFEEGSYIIDLGASTTKPNALRPYGLVYELIVKRGVPVVWIIAENKTGGVAGVTPATADPDLTALVQVDRTGAVDVTKTYRSGAFVIPAERVDAEVDAAVAKFESTTVVDVATESFSASVYEEIVNWPRVALDAANGSVAVPYFTSEAAWPTTLDMISGWVLVGVLAVLGVLLRGRWVPAAYFMRFLAIVQLTAQVWFWLAPPPFAYSLPDYISGLVVCGVVVLLLAPFLVGFTFHVFDFLLWQKAAMVVLLLGHLAIMLPMQATIHAWMIQRGSLLAMPMLYFVFGVLIDVFVYVALYGWGMSWRSGGVLDAVDRRPPLVPRSQLRAFPRPRPTPAVGGPIVPPKGGPYVAPGA
jgi:hypothetical protein